MIETFSNINVPTQKILLPFSSDIELYIKRIDLVHPQLSGNKYYKLKYNLIEAQKNNKNTIVTFGGAYSNHIAAVASLHLLGPSKTVGIIRGDELAHKELNATLARAKSLGMQLHFINRDEYRLKEESAAVQKILQQYQDFYLIPEGGTNENAVRGTAELLQSSEKNFDIIAAAVGTGGTLAGLSRAALPHQKIVGFPALKNASFLIKEVQKFSSKNNFELDLRYHFGGYGKWNNELLKFIQTFKEQQDIELDVIYTGKMMYGIMKNIAEKEYPQGTKILAIHSGGVQGNKEIINKIL